jgi:RNA polymerase sigma-70 factor (ECF subfamily)
MGWGLFLAAIFPSRPRNTSGRSSFSSVHSMKTHGDNGDSQRLARWVREHGGVVRGFLLARVHDEHAADDLLQEVFYRAWKARDRYRDDGKERSYLLCIADRLACDRSRRRRHEQTLPDDAWRQATNQYGGPETTDLSPVEVLDRTESKNLLNDALGRLSEPQRRTLLLRYFGQMEFQEIGRTLEIPLSTALSHARRGLLALKRLLSEKTT